jgi:hypothetical protein
MNLHERLENIEKALVEIREFLVQLVHKREKPSISTVGLGEYKLAMKKFAAGDRRELDKILKRMGGKIPK